MGMRPFVEEDIPRVAQLYEKVFLHGPLQDAALPYYKELFFDNPWYDEELSSLVWESNDDEIVGFVGLLPRPMTLRGRPLRAAVATQFMVDPDWRRHLIATQMLTKLFRGSQDLVLADTVDDIRRRVWVGCGGFTSILHSLHWVRMFRPFQCARTFMLMGESYRPFFRAVKPLCYLGDLGVSKVRPFCPSKPDLLGEEVSCEVLAAHAAHARLEHSVCPAYDEDSLNWLLRMAQQKKGGGSLQMVLVRGARDRIVGWYSYYLAPGGLSRVAQIGGDPESIKHVLDHLFFHAWQGGSIALRGRFAPHLVDNLSESYVGWNGPWTVFHSSNPEVVEAFHAGDAFFTWLDGDGWVDLDGYRQTADAG